MNLILLDPAELGDSGDVTLSGARARHMVNVLRVGPGHHVRVGVLDGPIGVAIVQAIGGDGVTMRCTFDAALPPRPAVDLLLALPRPKVMRRLWAQIAALGVGRVILTNAERVERQYFDTHLLRPESYGPLLVEGLQQARDTRRPPVSVHKQFRILVEDDLGLLFPEGQRLVAEPGEPATAASRLRDHGAGRVLLAVGPEGGWNPFETSLLHAHGFQPIGMGRRTLRTDTACVALLALVHDALAQTRT
jgi:RsmE family RNA methyltransferase